MSDKTACPNRQRNKDQCVCTNTDCERRGLCCECIASHRSKGGLPACVR
jgi:hypothetical protein